MGVELRTFDAFPKVERSYENRGTASTSLVDWGFRLFGLVFLWLQTTTLMGAHTDYEFSVDTTIADTFQVNMVLNVATPCQLLDVFIVDAAGDQLLLTELMEMENLPTLTAEGDTKDVCSIRGIFKANRVAGTIVVGLKRQFRYRPIKEVDFSHTFGEMSFGQFHPSLRDPLDGVARVSTKPTDFFSYLTTIVPTTIKALGQTIETTQYSVATFTNDPSHQERQPGIYLVYDFDPINVTLIDSRMTFFQWLFRVANIYGGVMILARSLKHKKSQRQSEGLLDEKV